MVPDRHLRVSTTSRPGSRGRRVAAFVAAMLTLGSVPASAQTLEELAGYSGPDRTARLIAGAKREGGVTLY